eukprot:jgi/Psemu1/17979/gm1.17979_g
MEGSHHGNGRRPTEIQRASPSYFRNVVSLGLSPQPASSSAFSSPPNPARTSTTYTTPKTNWPQQQQQQQQQRQQQGGGESSKGKILVDNLLLRLPEISEKAQHQHQQHEGLIPAASPPNTYHPEISDGVTPVVTNVRSRRTGGGGTHRKPHKRHRRRRARAAADSDKKEEPMCLGCLCGGMCRCCRDRKIVRSTLSCMNVVARILSWCTVVASVAGVVWYSYELKKTG